MPLRLYLDEDTAANRLRDLLRDRGHEVTTAFERGMRQQPDHLHLELATSLGMMLVTSPDCAPGWWAGCSAPEGRAA